MDKGSSAPLSKENPYLNDDPLDNTQRYLPLLFEIRRKLFLTIVFFIAASAVGFIFYEKIIRFVLNIFQLEGVNIVFTSPFQFINLAIQSSLIVGLIAVFPVILVQLIAFLRPALSPKEFKKALIMTPTTLILFITGFTYGISIMRYTIVIFYQKSQELAIGNLLDVSAFISQILLTALLMGIAFQFPLILTVLIKVGLANTRTVAKKRVFFYAGSLIFASLLPPTDLLSLVFLFAPLIVLFEATLILNKTFLKKKS